LDVAQPDGNLYISNDVRVTNNYCKDNSQGSLIASVGSANTSTAAGEKIKNFLIANNIGENNAGRGLIRFRHFDGGTDQKVQIIGNKVENSSQLGIAAEPGDGTPGESQIVVAYNEIINPGNFGIRIDQDDYVITGNFVRDAGNSAISARDRGTITGNNIRVAAGNGIGAGDKTTVVGNRVMNTDVHGIQGGLLTTIGFNLIDSPNQANNGSDGINLQGSDDQTVLGNTINGGSTGINEGSGGDNNVIVGNFIVNASTDFNIVGDHTVVEANVPAFFDLNETVSLSGGASGLTSAVPRADPTTDHKGGGIHVTPNGDPDNDVVFDARPYFDDSAGALKVQVEETANAGGGTARVKVRTNP
jgi:parallel beta-helix repeat protein